MGRRLDTSGYMNYLVAQGTPQEEETQIQQMSAQQTMQQQTQQRQQQVQRQPYPTSTEGMDMVQTSRTNAGLDPIQLQNAKERAKIGTDLERRSVFDPIDEEATARDKEGALKATGQERLQGKEIDNLTLKFGQAGRVVQAMRNLVGYGEAMDEAGIPNWLEQAISKGGDKIIPFLSDEVQSKYAPVLAMMAQLEETKIGQVPIISGQARYVVDLANAIEKTQAQVGGSTKIRKELAAQSTRNMMTLVYGIQNGFTSVKKLKSLGIDPDGSPETWKDKDAKALLNSITLTKEQEVNVDAAVDYVLSARPIIGGKMEKDNAKLKDKYGLE